MVLPNEILPSSLFSYVLILTSCVVGRKYRALSDAADSAMDDGDKQRLAVQAEQYYTDNLHSIKAMDTAFKSLHADLGRVQKTLANFVEERGV